MIEPLPFLLPPTTTTRCMPVPILPGRPQLRPVMVARTIGHVIGVGASPAQWATHVNHVVTGVAEREVLLPALHAVDEVAGVLVVGRPHDEEAEGEEDEDDDDEETCCYDQDYDVGGYAAQVDFALVAFKVVLTAENAKLEHGKRLKILYKQLLPRYMLDLKGWI